MGDAIRRVFAGLTKRLTVLRQLPPILESAWSLAPRLLLSSAALRVVSAVLPVGILWITKKVLDALTVHRSSWHHLLSLIGIELALMVTSDVLQRTGNHIDTLLGDRFVHGLNERILDRANQLPLEMFEDPTFQDRLERIRSQANVHLSIVLSLMQTAQNCVSLVVSLFAVVLVMPWFVVVQIAAILPVVLVEMHFASVVYRAYRSRTAARRELEYLLLLGTSASSAKEVKLFGFGDYLTERYRLRAQQYFGEDASISLRRNRIAGALSLLSTAAYYGCYVWLVFKTYVGSISIGSLLFLAGNFQKARESVQSLFSTFARTVDQATYLTDIAESFEENRAVDSVPGGRPAPEAAQTGFEFRNVSFTYEGAADPTLRNVSFSLRPGQRLALIGENGAGKSTLVKLLCGLYQPTEGAVLYEGVDLREYDQNSLRRLFSVAFQDYVHYDMLASENIGVGEIKAVDLLARAEDAAAKAQATDIVNSLPKRFAQMLGKRFEAGIDLSVGQWQKIALARACMRDALVLILDEPSASLDPRAETELFERFAALSANRMTVLVSHRLATVRMADRILVLSHDRLIEEGTHDTLLEVNGEYASLFRMQSTWYQ